jgi:addiction module HigA family antidote
MADILHRDDLAGIDWSDVSTGETIGPVPPGAILRADFMEPHALSARALARDLGVPANLVTGILNGQRAMTARTAILLGQRFGNSAEFWMNLQTAHDLEQARTALAHAAE